MRRRDGVVPLRVVTRDVQGGRRDQDYGIARSARPEHVLPEHGELRRRQHLDRYGQWQLAAGALAPAAAKDRPARLANGDPNIAGDWAGEQRVMTDPRGQRARSCRCRPRRPMLRATCRPAARPSPARVAPPSRSPRIPSIRTGTSAAVPLPLTRRGHKAAIAGLDLSIDRQSAPRLPADEHHVRLDVRDRHQPNHAERDRDARCSYGSMGLDRTIYLRSARASGERRRRA